MKKLRSFLGFARKGSPINWSPDDPVKLLLKDVRWYNEGSLHRGDVRIGRERIVETGPNLQPDGERVQSLPDHILFPGLVNGHDHLELNLFPRLGNPPYENFYQWGEEIYQPDENPIRQIQATPLTLRLLWSALKNLLGGATTVVHHNPYHHEFFDDQFPIRVTENYVWAHSLGHHPSPEEEYRADRPFVIHAAEGVDERARAEVEELARRGLLRTNTVLVHGVGISPDNRSIGETGTSLVWCPTSNEFLFGSTAPVDRLIDQTSVALGTDSTLSGAGSLLDEIRAAYETSLVTADELVHMATDGARSVFDLPESVGRIVPGASADLVAVQAIPGHPVRSLVGLPPQPPDLVFVGGRPNLASEALAAALRLGSPNLLVGDRAYRTAIPVRALMSEIEQHIDEDILRDNPIWSRTKALRLQ